jgi:RimJ/RimL family protein N-acetyltransferase
MSPDAVWPSAEVVETPRVCLEPLRVLHAEEVAVALNDPALHQFIGGEPASVDELESRFARQVVGHSADVTQGWLNWVVRDRVSMAVVGTMQATLRRVQEGLQSEVAWVVAAPWQGQGLAKEAALAMVSWLRDNGVDKVMADIHPENVRSAGVARYVGLMPTDRFVEGEQRWESG